jgi:superfamily II DNA or RNA helicase
MMLELREAQLRAIQMLREGFAAGHRSQILVGPTGFGKTECAIALLEATKKKGNKAAMILDRIVLCDQTSQRLEKYKIDHGVLQSGHWRYRPYENIQVCSAQTLEKRGSFPGLSLLVIDECFLGDTIIDCVDGKKRIDKIRDGDLIYNATGTGVVRSIFSKTVFRTLLVRLSNGESFECTEDHPIFTDLGWRPAGSLARGEKLFCRQAVRALWQGGETSGDSLKKGGDHSRGGINIQKASILRELLRQESEQPNAQTGVASKNDGNFEAHRPQASGARWEWNGHDACGKNDAIEAALGLGFESHGEDLEKASTGLSAPLQVGLSSSIGDALSGAGRGQSRSVEPSGARQEEGCFASSAWVESVQDVEHPSGKVVFNLRVGGHPSYFANGFLVHNCHAKRRQTTDFIKNNPHIKVVGLSATPLTKGLGDIYTNIVNPVTTKELVDDELLVPLRVFVAKEIDMTGAKKIAGEWSEAEATKRGMQITGDIVSEWIKKTHEIYGKPVKTIVFCSGVAHGEDLSRKFAEQGYNFISISYKDDGDFKREVIEDFGKPDTDIHGLIATDVLTKGFSVDDVMIGVSARPFSKSLSSHIQQMGRVMRTHPSKSFATWLCHSGNYLRFQEDWEEIYNNGVHELDDAREKAKKEKTDKEKEAAKCPKCGHLWAGGSDTCIHCGYTREKRSMVESVPGEMEELKAAASRESKQDWYSMCQYMVKNHGWSTGRAAHTYKDKFGVWPKGLAETPKAPTVEFDKAVKAALIRYLKGKGKK